MAEPPNLMLKAREILATPSHQGLESFFHQISLPRESTKFQTAHALFNLFVDNFANCLTLKILELYRSSSNDVLRLQSISFLSETLAELKRRRFELSLVALNEIKPLLISCLMMQEIKESEIKILRRVVSFVAFDVVALDNDGWDELSDCIVELANIEPLKAVHVFVDLPPISWKFIDNCGGIVVDKTEKLLFSPDEVQDWSLGLQAVIKCGIQLMDSAMRFDLIKNLISLLVKAATDLVEKGMEQFLVGRLGDLEMFLLREKSLYHYNKQQCDFVSAFLYKIRDLGTHTKEATDKIHRFIKSSPSLVPAGSEREWLDRLNNLSPVEILISFASTDLEERFRDMAIRRLNLLLSNLASRKDYIPMMRELQPLPISCLSKKEGVSESMFKVLGEVVYHVAYEAMNFKVEIWNGLSDYIASNCKTEFQRAAYIFQCLTMWLEDDFMFPVMESLLPEIRSRLKQPPRECWVLAFVGGFCAIIHLKGGDTVKEMTDEMVDSVRELVERGMEVGLVRRAFRDVESVVKKQKGGWFGKDEYILIKSLLERLYVIKGMKMESKIVLWRINVFVDTKLTELARQGD